MRGTRRLGLRKLMVPVLGFMVIGMLISGGVANAVPPVGFHVTVNSDEGEQLVDQFFPASDGWVFGDRIAYRCAYMYLVQGGVNVARMTIEHAGAYGAVISDKFGDEHVPGTPCGTDDTPLSFGGPAGPFTIGADSFQLEGLLSDATWATGGCAAGSPYDYLIYDGEPIVKVTVESLGGAVGPCPLPSLASFSPTSGSFGTSIVLRGSSFIGVTGVAFDGSPAASFSVDSPTQITATLPRSATTGDVSVTTANGTASSTSRFTVTHRSALTIRLRHSKGDLVATGTVRIPDGTQHCWGERLVVVEGRVSHQWHALGTLTTHPDGSFAGRVRPADGWIRGRVKQRRLAGGDICEPAEGNVRAHGLV